MILFDSFCIFRMRDFLPQEVQLEVWEALLLRTGGYLEHHLSYGQRRVDLVL